MKLDNTGKNPFMPTSKPIYQDQIDILRREANPFSAKKGRININLKSDLIPNFEKQTKSNRLKIRKQRISNTLSKSKNYNSPMTLTDSSLYALSNEVNLNDQIKLNQMFTCFHQNGSYNESEITDFVKFVNSNPKIIQAKFELQIVRCFNLHKCLLTILASNPSLKSAIEIVIFYNILCKVNHTLLDHLYNKGLMKSTLKILMKAHKKKKVDLKFEFAEKAISLLSLFISSIDEALKMTLTTESIFIFEVYFQFNHSLKLHIELLDFFLISVFVYKKHTSLSCNPYSEYFCCNTKILRQLIENLKSFCQIWLKPDDNDNLIILQNKDNQTIVFKTLNLLISFSKICDSCNEVFIELDLHCFIAEAIISVVMNQALMPHLSGEILYAMLYVLGNMISCNKSYRVSINDKVLSALNSIIFECVNSYEWPEIAEKSSARQVEILTRALYALSNIACDSQFDISKYYFNLQHLIIFETYHMFFKVKKVKYECIYVLCNISLVKSKEDLNSLIDNNFLRIITENFQWDSAFEIEGLLLETVGKLISQYALFYGLRQNSPKLSNKVIRRLANLGFIELLENAKTNEYELIAFKAEELLIQHFTFSEEASWDEVMQEEVSWKNQNSTNLQNSSCIELPIFDYGSTAMSEDYN